MPPVLVRLTTLVTNSYPINLDIPVHQTNPGQTETQVRGLARICDELRSLWKTKFVRKSRHCLRVNPFGHPARACTQVELAIICVPSGQGLTT